jgi:hypothetical protein
MASSLCRVGRCHRRLEPEAAGLGEAQGLGVDVTIGVGGVALGVQPAKMRTPVTAPPANVLRTRRLGSTLPARSSLAGSSSRSCMAQEPFSRTYPHVDKPCVVSASCFTEGSCTQPFRHRASAPLSTSVLTVRGTPGQWCDVLQHPHTLRSPLTTTGLVFAHQEGKCRNLAAQLRVQTVPY